MMKFEALKKEYEGKIITTETYDEIMENNVSTDYAGKIGNCRLFIIYDNKSNDCFRVTIA